MDLSKQIEEKIQEFDAEVNTMGVEDFIVPVKQDATYTNKEQLFEAMEHLVKVAGLEKVVKRQFKHVAR